MRLLSSLPSAAITDSAAVRIAREHVKIILYYGLPLYFQQEKIFTTVKTLQSDGKTLKRKLATPGSPTEEEGIWVVLF